MTAAAWIEGLAAFCLALFIGSLVEYGMHRVMHAGVIYGANHAKHHREGTGQGWFGEFLGYFLPSLFFIWLGFLVSVAAGIGFALGGALHAVWSAYAHQLQHERPELVFWMKRPVHHLHHAGRMWHHNFGISSDIWDRIFGTYRPVEWDDPGPVKPAAYAGLFTIKWF